MSEHQVKHRWREEIILPIRCIVDNINFLTHKDDIGRYIISTDNIKAQVEQSELIHICELEDEIKRLYGMSAFDFMKKWYDNGEEFDAAHFVYIKSKKV